MKFFAWLLAVFFGFLFFPLHSSFASSNFSTSYNVLYEVFEAGNTHAVFNIGLTNNSDGYYASSYKIKTGFDTVRDVKGSDAGGSLATNVAKTDEGQEIEVIFNQRVVGKGNTLPFTLSFYTSDIAHKQGNIWEVDIPGIVDQNDFTKFNVNIKVPPSFGEPSYIKPEVKSKSLSFTKDQLGKSGISIAFGEKQIYKFSLSYHLSNTRLVPVKTEIAIPPSTNYQDVYIDKVDPLPQNVVEDSDGNWLAEYVIPPGKKVNVEVLGKAQVFLYPKKEVLTEDKRKIYLKEKPFWEQDEKVKELAKTLKTPEAIYEYVVKILKYDFSRVTEGKPRLGAKQSLNNPSSAVCLEFADLFVAIARAARIPAREVDGFAYTENQKQRPLSLVKDVLHAWPEYYDDNLQTWVMVDPTWGNTTKGVDYFNVLDFDHFAFVVHGVDSDYPIPAGGYKLAENSNTKDVNVDFTLDIKEVNSSIEIFSNIPQSVLSGFAVRGDLILKNQSQAVYPASTIKIESDKLYPKSSKQMTGSIPPYGYIKIPITFKKTPFLTNTTAQVKITVGEKTISQPIKVSLLTTLGWFTIAGGILVAGITILISIVARKSRSLPFYGRKRDSPLRGEGEKPAQ